MIKFKTTISLTSIVVCTIMIIWLFFGFDRYVGDHETGSHWELFLKSAPTWQLTFKNPAQMTLEVEPFEQLNSKQQSEMTEYCKVRYGMSDIVGCYKEIEERRI
jgi:hypothetical protein